MNLKPIMTRATGGDKGVIAVQVRTSEDEVRLRERQLEDRAARARALIQKQQLSDCR
jgi:hypothetical protein